ncbi:MAG: NADP-dependent phosphogluconate dehydrogenase [Phycisphaerales bacterium]|nr:NADP-dependent phosphogluconate dehydrogenase [Phycisphaerales bacterium]
MDISSPSRLNDIGLIGLGVMGRSLILNMADHGYWVAVYNRDTPVTDKFIADNAPGSFGSLGGGLVPCKTLEEFIRAIKRPRIIVMMVTAGPPVDMVTEGLIAAGIEPEDIVVDGGNSLFTDTIARELKYRGKLIFFGSGVSGGEEGARYGPSLMPGGDLNAWMRLKPVWENIAAKVDAKTGKQLSGASPGHPTMAKPPRAEPCAAYIGPNGAGHYVKMVHNGIEYADMQLIAEAYFLMKTILKMKPDEMSEVFSEWNQGELDSYLIEITADILKQRDPANPRKFLVDSILDTAGQKGTGRWTSQNALEIGAATPTVTEAVYARIISAMKEKRVAASKILKGPHPQPLSQRERGALIDAIRDALYCSKICAYAQGFELMAEAQKVYNWNLDLGRIAMIWRGGCIIRARFLQRIKLAYQREPALANLMLDPFFRRALARGSENWRQVIALAAQAGAACPCFMSALSYFDSYRTAVLPANLIQAQRDYFGAHTFERTDAPRGVFVHIDWPNPKRPMIEVSAVAPPRPSDTGAPSRPAPRGSRESGLRR